MAKPKYKTGDKVIITTNDLQPQFRGVKAVVKKVFQSMTENDAWQFVYRLEVDGEVLRGVAFETDMKPA